MINNEEIERKRQELRDERNASREQQSGTANTNIVRYSAIADGAARPGLPSLGRTSETVRPTSGQAGTSDPGNVGTQRSSEEKPVGERPGRRRLGSPRPSLASPTETTRESNPATFGSIERVDAPFFRPEPEEKKTTKKTENIVTKLVSKLPDSSDDIPFIGGKGKTKLFTKKDTEDQYEPLKQAIADYGDYLDIYMQRLEPDHPPTWGNFTEKELDIVTRALLKRAQTDAKAASFTRLMIDGQDYIGAFVILVPRVSITLQFVGRRLPRRGQRNAHKD
jgi:hypothetical protein